MIEIKNLSIHMGEFFLKNLNLKIQDKEYFILLGPSGAGKTVFLECLAGLQKIKHGEIWIDNQNVTGSSPEERNIGYVPQDYVLFPFLNVAENIQFGLKRKKYTKATIREKMMILAEILGINHLLNRDIRNLSGGEKQRVALARALATTPKILLLDEPLSALDVQTSTYLRLELRRIHQELGVTTIHVTHNHLEAEELADRIAVISRGEIVQVGNPHDIFFYPQNEAVADFIGSPNILSCDACRQLVPGLIEVDCAGMPVVVPHDENNIMKIAISPRDIYVSDVLPPGPSVNRYKGFITGIDLSATIAKLTVKTGNNNLKAEIPASLAQEMGLIIGKEVYYILKLRRLRVLENPPNR